LWGCFFVAALRVLHVHSLQALTPPPPPPSPPPQKNIKTGVAAHVAEARLELAAGNAEQAVAATGRLLKAAPGHLEALALRGRAYMLLGDHDLAKRHYVSLAVVLLLFCACVWAKRDVRVWGGARLRAALCASPK
jgi:Tfp pilus assembly protein PilF